MKRQLSLVLALVMILGTFTSVFAANTVDADAAKVASEFLKKQGVLVGDTTGDLNLDKNLLRQDTVVLVSKLMGEYDKAKAFVEEGKPTYEDVRDPFYLPLLAWAQANETFVGHTDAKFGFGENLTAQEYAKVLLVALEYTVGPNGDKDVSWADVLVKAKDLGLLADVEVENATEILRSQMAVMTFNALGTKLKGSDKTLADKLGITMPAPDVLTAEVKDTENLKEVVLELSNAKLADAEKLANKDNYRVDNIKVERVTVDGDNVILELNKVLVKNRSYDLVVRNIDKAINKTYSFKANDNASPKVEKVEVLGEYGIKVTVSEPVDPDKVKETDFLVDGRNVAMELEQYGRVLVLTPYHKSAFSASAEKLTIKGLEDFAGYKSALEDFEIKIEKDEVAPKVVDAVVKGNIVEITFDKDVYADSVKGYKNRTDEGNISYRDGRNTIFTIQHKDGEYGKKIDTNKVEYEFKDNLPRGTEVTVEGVQNHSKVTMERTTLGVREVKDNLEPEIIDVDVDKRLAKNEATITLEFDKAVYGFENAAKTQFDVAKHFTLYTEEVLKRNIVDGAKGKVVSAKYKGTDKTKIVVELENLQENNDDKDYDYILEVVDFEDSSRNRMYRDYVEFELKETKTLVVENIVINEDTKNDKTVVTIDFNFAVDRARAEDLTNYLFRTKATAKAKDVKDLDGEIEVSRNGKTVTIELPEFKYADYTTEGTFEITEGLRDKDGNKLAKAVVYNFATGTTVEQDVAVQNVKDLITELPATVTVDHKDDIKAARVAYDALTKAGKAQIAKADLDKLVAAEAALVLAEATAADEKVKTQILAEAAVLTAEADATKLADARAAVVNAVKAKVDKAITDALTARLNLVEAKADVATELANVVDTQLVKDSTADVATIKTAVEDLVDTEKVTVAVEADGEDWKVTLTSKLVTDVNATKTIKITVAE